MLACSSTPNTQVASFFRFVDSLCGIVRGRGLRCSTPLADVPLPTLHALNVSGSAQLLDGAERWIHELEPIMTQLDVWAGEQSCDSRSK